MSSTDNEYCSGVFPSFFVPGTEVEILRVLGGSIYGAMCIASIVFIQYAKAAARDVNNYTDSNSDEYAKAESIVLPNFVRVLYWQAVTSLVSGIVVLTVTINPSSENGKLAAGCFALIWAFQHGVVEGTAFLLQQKGCGEYAAMIARTITFCFFWVVFFFNFMVFRFGRRAYVFQMLLDVFLLTYFGVMWLAPQIHVHRRPALIFYSKFWFFFRGLVMILHILYVFDSIHSYISCTFYLYRVLSFAVFQPVLLYKAFLLDSLYWQGIVAGGEKDISRMTMQESNVPLGTALYLAQALDNMKLTSNAKLLNFAFLDFEKETLGQGSFSVVVLGHYKKEPVAIKKIRTQDLTIEVIQRIVAEATILSSMKDPNVVGIYGVSILPPSICIVLEACKYGSLGDVIRGVGNIEQPKYYTPPLNINIYDKLYLALGCAKGLAAVHAFSPNLSHRDVKSYNFLVDYQMNVKIADLELGDGAEELPNPYWMCDISKCDPCALFSKSKEVVDNEDVSPDAPMPEVHPSMVNMQAMWLAPEVLRSGEFKQSADVFSLAIVLWEIRTSKFPYEHCKFFQRQIRECILQGYRHPFPDASMDPQRARTMKAYDDLVQAAWSEDPDQRPTAAVIAKSLEKILNECCYEIMLSKPISNYVESIAAVGDCFDFPDLSSNADNGSSELGLVDEPAFPVRQTISRDGVAACCNNLDIECGAWLVVSLEPPFNIMHVTRAFCSEFSSQSQFLSRKTASLTDVLVELGFELPAPSAPTRIKSVSAVEMMRSFVNGVLLNLKSRSYEHLLLLLIDDDSFSDYSVHFYFVDTSVIDSDKKSPSATKSSGFVAILFSNLLADRNQHRRTLKDLQDAENQGIVNGAVNALRASASVDKNRTISSSRAISRDQAKIHTKAMGASCTENIWEVYPVHVWLPAAGDSVGVGVFIIGVVHYVNSLLTFMWIQAQRGKALHGDESAARYVIFPIYVPFMWASAVSDVIVASLLIFSGVNLTDANNWSNSIFVAITFAFQHFAIEGVAFLLMQYGCGRQASIRAGSVGFAWVLVTFSIYVCIVRFSYSIMISLEIFIESILFLFYLAMWKLPMTSLFRRKALIPYARFWCIFRLIALVLDIFSVATGGCYKHFYVFPLLALVIAKPYTIYFTLLNDSAWWQGASGSVKSGNQTHGQLFSPLLGIEVSYSGAQELAQEIDNLNTQGTVKLLNFAYLSLNSGHQLGSGSFSKVYSGAYKGTPVAIKLLFTVDLNPEVIKRCSSEAQILSKISHPNVVDIFGVAVLPPSVCIVLEICQHGSLSDVIRGGIIARNSEIIQRNPLGLTITDKMFLALGCARGLHALHSFDKTLVHRDIKSSNFLVDAQLNAKICDLELGGSSASSIDAIKDGMLCTWQAPEIMRGNDFTQASDIYALGLVLWEIITGKVPFAEYGRGRNEIMYQVLRGARPYVEISDSVPPAYYQLMEACWADDVSSRPDSAYIVYELYLNCWLYTVHSKIVETIHTIDNKTLIECYEAERSNMAIKTAFSNYRPQNRRGSMPLVVSQALLTVRRESQWEMLEQAGAFLILSAEFPFLVLGATKKWSQITGFLLSDIIARDLSFLEGTLSNKVLLRYTCSEASQGRAAHAVLTHYRRDGTAFVNSVHAVPIYDGNYYRNIGTLTSIEEGDVHGATKTTAAAPAQSDQEPKGSGGNAVSEAPAVLAPRTDLRRLSSSFRMTSGEGSGNSSVENHRALLAAIGASYEGGTMASPNRSRALSAHLSAAIVPPVQVNPDDEDSVVRHQRKAEIEEMEQKRALDAVEKKYLRKRGDSKGSASAGLESPAHSVSGSKHDVAPLLDSMSLSVSEGVNLTKLLVGIEKDKDGADKHLPRPDAVSTGLGVTSSSSSPKVLAGRVSFIDMERGTSMYVPGTTPPISTLISRDSKMGSNGTRPSEMDDSSTAPRTAYIVLQFAVISNARL